MDTIGSTVIARNGPDGLWSEDEVWQLENIRTIGSRGGDGPDVFGRIHAVGIGPHGNTFIIDGQAGEIRVFEPDGDFVRGVGRGGEGPGELSRPSGLAWDAMDHLWVPEYGNSRYSLFDSAGAFLKTVTRRVRPWGDRQLWGYDSEGWFADELGLPPTSGHVQKGFARVDTTGAVIDSVLFVGDPVSTSISVLTRFPTELARFATTPVFSAPQGGHVWFAMSDEYRLLKMNIEGDTVRIAETEHRRPSLTAEEQNLIDRLLAENDLERSDFPLGRQIVRAIHLLEDGHLLVQIEDDNGGSAQGDRGNILDVFDPRGRFLGTLETSFLVDAEVAAASRGNEVIFVTRDSMDVTYAVRATLERRDP